MPSNVGFGAAVNAGFAQSHAAFLATINDDAVASPQWLAKLLRRMDRNPRLGSCASSVHLAGEATIDSAGMMIAIDGSSKQRGHGQPAADFLKSSDALMPSGSGAIYRRELIEQTGGFDPDFFLYCEDADLGLRARWAGWECAYEPEAVVEHKYSHSAGRASALKAYFVERNRLRLIVKNFPLPELLAAPFAALVRYFWHLAYAVTGQGKAHEFAAGNSPLLLAWFVVRAHLALIPALPQLLRQRSAIRRSAAISTSQFRQLLTRHSISLQQVASL